MLAAGTDTRGLANLALTLAAVGDVAAGSERDKSAAFRFFLPFFISVFYAP